MEKLYMLNKKLKKAISISVLIVFFSAFVVPDARAVLEMEEMVITPQTKTPGEYANLDIESFTVPAHLGEIKYLFKGKPKKVIIHIQDAHCNRYAQRKVADIIGYITGEYGVKTINLEGGVGNYDLSAFTSITGEAIRSEVADYFLKKGEINGAEFFAINNPERTFLWGVEDKDLYLANLKVYRDSLRYRDEVDKYLDELTHIMNNLKMQIYSPELLNIDMNYTSFKLQNMDFREYFEFLIGKAREHGIDLGKFRDLNLLKETMEQEKAIDFEKANAERNTLIGELKERVSKADQRQIVAMTIDFKTKKASQKVFYTYLLDMARNAGIDVKKFPAMESYLKYVSTFEEVDRFKIMEEIDGLDEAVRESVFQNDTQRRLSDLSRTLTVLKNIFAIRINKTDYKYYLAHKDSFDVINFITFIEKEAPKYRITAQLDRGIARMDDYREELSEFFEFSFKRDEVFLKNLKFDKVTSGTEAAVLMTGGFHTENLCELLRKEGISYVSVHPRFTMPKGYESPYFDILAGETTGIQEALRSVLAQASTAMMQVASFLSAGLADAVWSRAGVDAFLASIMLRALVARGYAVTFEYTDASGVTHRLDLNEAFDRPADKGAPRIALTPENIIKELHQRQADESVKAAKRENIEDIPEARGARDEAIGRLEKVVSELSGRGYAAAAEEAQKLVDELKRKDAQGRYAVTINLLTEGDVPIFFKEQAGGMGLHVNRASVARADGSIDTEKLVELIVHGISAGFTSDHGVSGFIQQVAMGESKDYGELTKRLTPGALRPGSVWQAREIVIAELGKNYNEEEYNRRMEDLLGDRDLFEAGVAPPAADIAARVAAVAEAPDITEKIDIEELSEQARRENLLPALFNSGNVGRTIMFEAEMGGEKFTVRSRIWGIRSALEGADVEGGGNVMLLSGNRALYVDKNGKFWYTTAERQSEDRMIVKLSELKQPLTGLTIELSAVRAPVKAPAEIREEAEKLAAARAEARAGVETAADNKAVLEALGIEVAEDSPVMAEDLATLKQKVALLDQMGFDIYGKGEGAEFLGRSVAEMQRMLRTNLVDLLKTHGITVTTPALERALDEWRYEDLENRLNALEAAGVSFVDKDGKPVNYGLLEATSPAAEARQLARIRVINDLNDVLDRLNKWYGERFGLKAKPILLNTTNINSSETSLEMEGNRRIYDAGQVVMGKLAGMASPEEILDALQVTGKTRDDILATLKNQKPKAAARTLRNRIEMVGRALGYDIYLGEGASLLVVPERGAGFDLRNRSNREKRKVTAKTKEEILDGFRIDTGKEGFRHLAAEELTLEQLKNHIDLCVKLGLDVYGNPELYLGKDFVDAFANFNTHRDIRQKVERLEALGNSIDLATGKNIELLREDVDAIEEAAEAEAASSAAEVATPGEEGRTDITPEMLYARAFQADAERWLDLARRADRGEADARDELARLAGLRGAAMEVPTSWMVERLIMNKYGLVPGRSLLEFGRAGGKHVAVYHGVGEVGGEAGVKINYKEGDLEAGQRGTTGRLVLDRVERLQNRGSVDAVAADFPWINIRSIGEPVNVTLIDAQNRVRIVGSMDYFGADLDNGTITLVRGEGEAVVRQTIPIANIIAIDSRIPAAPAGAARELTDQEKLDRVINRDERSLTREIQNPNLRARAIQRALERYTDMLFEAELSELKGELAKKGIIVADILKADVNELVNKLAAIELGLERGDIILINGVPHYYFGIATTPGELRTAPVMQAKDGTEIRREPVGTAILSVRAVTGETAKSFNTIENASVTLEDLLEQGIEEGDRINLTERAADETATHTMSGVIYRGISGNRLIVENAQGVRSEIDIGNLRALELAAKAAPVAEGVAAPVARKVPGALEPDMDADEFYRMVQEARDKGDIAVVKASVLKSVNRRLGDLSRVRDPQLQAKIDALKGLDVNKLSSVEIAWADLGERRVEALSVERAGKLTILMNSRRNISRDYLADDTALVHLIGHELPEAMGIMTHRELSRLEMLENKENALTVLGKLSLGHMTMEQLENITEGHELDPRNVFYRAAQFEMQIRLATQILERLPGGMPAIAALMGLTDEQMLTELAAHQGVDRTAENVLSRQYGQTSRVFHYNRNQPASLNEAMRMVLGWDKFAESKAAGQNPKALGFVDTDMPQDIINGFLAQDDVAGAVKQKLGKGQRVDDDLLLVLAASLIHLDRTGWRDKDLIKTTSRFVELLTGHELKDLTQQDLEKILRGVMEVPVMAINYGEIEDWKQARLAVLRSL